MSRLPRSPVGALSPAARSSDSVRTGDSLWLAYSRNSWNSTRGLKEVTVNKIGRAWITCSDGTRVSREDMTIDGGEYSSPGSAYRSASEYEEEISLNKAWMSLQDELRRAHRPADGVTVQDIAKVLEILRLPAPKV